MNIVHDQYILIELLSAKVETSSTVNTTKTFADVMAKQNEQPKESGVGNPKTLLISSDQEGATPSEIENKIKRNLKPRNHEMGVIKLSGTKTEFTVTTKNESNKELIDKSIKKNK